jgi:hypothetical protein
VLTSSPTQQLDTLLELSIADFDIPDDVRRVAEQRYHDVGDWLADYYDGNAADGVIYPQGSFLLGTVVQPISNSGEYDIDLVCRRDLLKTSLTQEELKRSVGGALRAYVATSPAGSPTQDEGKRCWTLHYPLERFHMDVLPAIPDADATPNAILITDRELRNWQHSNPLDYAKWFESRMAREFAEARALLAKRMDVDDVPAWTVKTTLQRTIQALKRHRDFYFEQRPDDRAASIIITTLAARSYQGAGDLNEVLVDTTGRMAGLIERRNGVWWVPNPIREKENFADRWEGRPTRADAFFRWIEQAQSDFTGLGVDAGVDRVVAKLAKLFGEQAAKHAGSSYATALAETRDRGKLGMAVGTGMLGAVSKGKPAVPSHTFHGDPED